MHMIYDNNLQAYDYISGLELAQNNEKNKSLFTRESMCELKMIDTNMKPKG